MPIVSGQLTLVAAAQRASKIYGGASGDGSVQPAQDVPLRQVLLQATGADAFVGATDQTTSTAYGTKVASTDLQPVTLGPFNNGGIKLSDLWVAGAGATLRILGVMF